MKRILIPLLLTILSMQMISVAYAWQLEWQLERPGGGIKIRERVESSSGSSDGAAAVGLGVFVDNYEEAAFGNRDAVKMNVTVTANSRRGISYGGIPLSLSWISESQLDPVTKQTLFDGSIGYDDAGSWFDFPSWFKFRFYGGRDSAEFNNFWVCTNGFLAFNLANSTAFIPTNTLPGMVAPLWTDLRIDSLADIISGVYHGGMPGQDLHDPLEYYVIIWKNVLPWDAAHVRPSGPRLTFEVVLQMAPPWLFEPGGTWGIDNHQSLIYFSYFSVGALDTNFAYGVGDQDGSGGYGGLHPGVDLASLNQQTRMVKQNSNNFFIDSLIVSGSDTNTANTNFSIERESNVLSGYHVVTGANSHNDTSRVFAEAIGGTMTLLIGLGGLLADVETMGLTFPIDFMLVGMQYGDYFAQAQSTDMTPIEIRDETNGYPNQFYIGATTGDLYDYAWSVDASMDFQLNWVFGEGGYEQHDLTITAQLNYYEYNLTSHTYTNKNVTTSVNLQMGPDTRNGFSSALPIQSGVNYSRLYIGTYDTHDYFKIFAASGNLITVNAHSTKIWSGEGTEPNFNLFIYDPNQNLKNWTSQGYISQHLTYAASSSGSWYVEVHKDSSHGFYSIKVDVGSGGGGCPYVSSWNGSQYVLDNNILPTSERGNGTDVEDYYKLEQPLLPRNGQYSILINEFEHEHSYIDQVRLLAVDHDSNVRIAVDPNGQILTYKNPTPPVMAVDNYGNSRLSEVRYMDGNISDLATYFDGYTGDYLVLNFGQVKSTNAKLILRDDKKSDEICIDVQVLNNNGQWQTVTTVTPRSYWAVEGVDLSRYVIRNRDFKVRLVWTSPHRLDYAGLDTSRQASYQITYATLVSVAHSTQGDVTTLLTTNDNTYAELIPGEQILINFTLPDNQRETRTYILYTEGHYITIPWLDINVYFSLFQF